MAVSSVPLTALSEDQRAQAHTRFTIIRPALEDGITQAQVARTHNIPASTIRRWVKRYREKGLAGLADAKARSDKGKSRRLPPEGAAVYRETFDLLYRRESPHANAMWQADHTPLDVLLLDETGTPAKPW